MASSALVVLASVTVLTAVSPAAPAQAAANYDCGVVYSLQGTCVRSVCSVDTATGTMTNNEAFTIASGDA